MRILRPQEIHLLRLGMPAIPANGGDSDSQANTSSTNNTTNNVATTDKRNVASEEAVSVSGDQNYIDRSAHSQTNTQTNFNDTSNRSSTTSFTDFSDRSTNYTVTDFGAIGEMLSTVGTVANRAIGSSEMLGMGAIDSLNKTGANSVLLAMKAFDSAKEQSANALTSQAQAMGLAKDSISETRAAFAEAKDGGTNKTMLIVALAVVGAVGVAVAMK